MTRGEAIRRVKKLAALARDPGAAKGEASTALAMAEKIAREHGLTSRELGEPDPSVFGRKELKRTMRDHFAENLRRSGVRPTRRPRGDL